MIAKNPYWLSLKCSVRRYLSLQASRTMPNSVIQQQENHSNSYCGNFQDVQADYYISFIQQSYVVYLKQMNKELFLTEAQCLILYFRPNTLHILLHLEPIICIKYSLFDAYNIA